MKDLDYVFWGAPLIGRPFEEHICAASAGSFTSLAIASSTVHEARRRGISLNEMRRQAADAGVPFRHYDSLATWAPMQLTFEQLGEDLFDRWTTSIDEALDICSELNLRNVLLDSGFMKGTVSQQQLVEGLGGFCARAVAQDLWVDLEPMPFLGVNTVLEALEIVKAAAQDNCGVLIDTWHFYKAGQTLDDLSTVPGKYLRTMQVADGSDAPPDVPLETETVTRRAWPGEGVLPLAALIEMILQKGSLTSIGQEVFLSELTDRSPEAVGHKAGLTFFRVLGSMQSYDKCKTALV